MRYVGRNEHTMSNTCIRRVQAVPHHTRAVSHRHSNLGDADDPREQQARGGEEDEGHASRGQQEGRVHVSHPPVRWKGKIQ